MAINQISNSSNINPLKSITSNNSTTIGGSANSSFSALLENISKNQTASSTGTNNVASIPDITKSNGITDLSMQSQKSMQMLQMQAFQNMMSNANIGSIDSTNDSSTSDTSSKSTDMSQLIETMLQNVNRSDDSNNTDTLNTSSESTNMSQLIETMLKNQNSSSSTSSNSSLENLVSQIDTDSTD